MLNSPRPKERAAAFGVPKLCELLATTKVNRAQLAKLLGCTRSAIYQWDDDKPIPTDRWVQLTHVRPEWADQFPGRGS
jgi:DNA-binding XRE family transcriptional regulator